VGDEKQLAGDSNRSPYARPSLECDIVMKGGITSGVVYPFAVTEIAKRYRLRNIGGTSAGAIAAAVTAAAEHNRFGGGFERVADLPDELGSAPGGKPFTLQLFTPDKKTRGLFEAAVGFMRWGKVRGVLNLFRWLPRALVPPVVLLLVAILVCALAGASAVWAVLAGFVAVLLLIVGLLAEALLAFRTIGQNDFGICHLGPGAGTKNAPALTLWLHRKIQHTAGRSEKDPPLTFADLWGVPPLPAKPTQVELNARRELLEILSREPRKRVIDLQMMTTSLSHGRPMRLPIPIPKHGAKLDDGGGLLFKPEEMRRFFPEAVVAHLERYGAGAHYLPDGPPPEGLCRFPIGPDLPVIVATRMSLSFPILITALSLWEYGVPTNDAAPPLKRVVFSDGGITSNFPIHFFDSPAPTRPTFGLQLTGFEAGDGPIDGKPEHSVEDPPSADEPMQVLRSDMDDLRGFLTAIKDAMQNWRDNTQSQLPGSRERIERIKMGRKEGGLNLTMDETKIRQLTGYGKLAGERLVTLFSGPPGSEAPTPTEHGEHHRFARYRVTMSVLERFLQEFAYGYTKAPTLGAPYVELIEEHTSQEPFQFGSVARRNAALTRSGVYRALADVSDPTSLDDEHVPRPAATLRSVPPT
jgi:predicted acylesterase/phospholipase RssA